MESVDDAPHPCNHSADCEGCFPMEPTKLPQGANLPPHPSLREFLNITLCNVVEWVWDNPGKPFDACLWRERIVQYLERDKARAQPEERVGQFCGKCGASIHFVDGNCTFDPNHTGHTSTVGRSVTASSEHC